MDEHDQEVSEQSGAGDYGGTPDPEETGAAEQVPPRRETDETGDEFEQGGDGSEG